MGGSAYTKFGNRSILDMGAEVLEVWFEKNYHIDAREGFNG